MNGIYILRIRVRSVSSLMFWVFTFIAITCAQKQLNDNCELENGQSGQCIRFKECPSAIDLVRNKQRPIPCGGYDGIEPIICCEPKQLHTLRQVGDISKTKCNETFYGLKIYGPRVGIPLLNIVASPTTTEASLTNLNPQFKSLQLNKIKLNEDSNVFAAVGGFDSPGQEFSHMAALGYGDWPNVTWGCGGSLISDKFVLTAGHCIYTQGLGRVKYVRLGDLNLKITTDIAQPQDFNVSSTILHPAYRPPSVYNDIALIELESVATINNFVRPACLHTGEVITASLRIATGWGATSFGGLGADHLQQVNLQEFAFEVCRNAFNTTSTRKLSKGIDDKSQVCAGDAKMDTCQGDSGGPLQIKNVNYSEGYTVVGVTSFGKACGISNHPGVYTRVSNYIQWIESIVWP